LIGKDFDALDFDVPVKLQTVDVSDEVTLPCFELV